MVQRNLSYLEPLHLGAMTVSGRFFQTLAYKTFLGKVSWDQKLLHMAARREQSKVLKILLDTGISPDSRLDAGPPGLTAAYLAAANGHPRCLQILLENGGEGSLVPGVSPLY